MRIVKFISPLLLAAALAGCNLSLAADVTPPPGYQPEIPQAEAQVTAGPVFPIVAPDPDKGAATYAEKCAPCHGVNGLGDGPQAANLPNPVSALGASDVSREAVPAEWFRVVTQGNLERFMPPFPSLNDRQRWDVVAYALSLDTTPKQVSEGADLFAENCAECHGAAGKGDGPKAEGRVTDLTDQEVMATRSGNALFQAISAGVEGKMPGFADKLSEDQRWALTAYLRSLTFAPKVAGQPVTPFPVEGTPQPEATVEATVAASAPLSTTNPISGTATVSGTLPISKVAGTIVNASGGSIPAGLDVTLHAFDQMQLIMTDTAKVAADGTFTFPEVDAPAGRAFLTTVEFDQVLYGSEVAVAEAPGQPITLTMQVYETSTDLSDITVDRLHYFYEFVDDQTLRVGELYIVSNNGKKTIVGNGPDQPVLSFMLPQGATNLQIQDGEIGQRYVETPNGFADTLPLRPGAGNYQVLYSYELPYDGKLELTRPIQFPTNAIIVLAPEAGLKVRSDSLTDGGTRDIQGVQYHTYNGAEMEAGSTLDLTLSGQQSGPTLLAQGTNQNLLVGAAALGLVLVVVGAFIFFRSRSGEAAQPKAVEPAPTAGDTKETVMDAILALDDLYQEGKLPEDAYLKRRAELKERLARLMEI